MHRRWGGSDKVFIFERFRRSKIGALRLCISLRDLLRLHHPSDFAVHPSGKNGTRSFFFAIDLLP